MSHDLRVSRIVQEILNGMRALLIYYSNLPYTYEFFLYTYVRSQHYFAKAFIIISRNLFVDNKRLIAYNIFCRNIFIY